MRCAECSVFACYSGKIDKAPKFCPMKNQPEVIGRAVENYRDHTIYQIFYNSASVEAEGYLKWCRVQETIEFTRRCGFKKIGIAFCIGLRNEAKVLTDILKKHSFEVYSVVCKVGSIAKEKLGLKKIKDERYEVVYNPIAQAMLLNKAGTELNIILSLCVGHDSLFIQYLNAPNTCLAVKDRVLAHNPLGAIYCSQSYYRKIYSDEFASS